MTWSFHPRAYAAYAAYAGLLTLTFGTLLWMVSERPEWRSAEGERAATTGRILSTVGQGGAATGGAMLAYRALRFVREQDQADETTPAEIVDRSVELRPRDLYDRSDERTSSAVERG